VPKARELEARLQRTEEQLRLFQKVSRFMVREMSLTEVLQGVVSLVVEFTEWHRFDRFDTRPAVCITRMDGQSDLLVLADKNRRTNALMAFPRRVAALLNEHAGR